MPRLVVIASLQIFIVSYSCDRFAALLAHCLNSDDQPWVSIDPGALYAQLINLLAEGHYAKSLLYHPVYAQRMQAEEAAARYFDATLARRLVLTGRVELSIAHRLLGATCERGTSPIWRAAQIDRAHTPLTVIPALADPSFEEVRQRLLKLPEQISAGSASPTIRARSGSVVLRAGQHSAMVPEEISAWNAVTCGPQEINTLPKGEPFNRFCSVMIDCVRTANRPFQEILGLGRQLCPFDWLDTLSIQQVRALRSFLKYLIDANATDSPNTWAAAFAHTPIPSFDNADDLWNSAIGFALRNAPNQRVVDLESIPELVAPDIDSDEFLGREEFLQQLELLFHDGIIDTEEQWLLGQLYDGAELRELARQFRVRTLQRRRAMNLDALLTDLQQRIQQWQQLAVGTTHES